MENPDKHYRKKVHNNLLLSGRGGGGGGGGGGSGDGVFILPNTDDDVF